MSSLTERASMLRYLLPDGRSWKRLWGGKEHIQDGGESGTDDLCSGVHCPLEGLAVSSTTVPVPDSDAAGQHALDDAPVEGGEDGWRET